ncbi:MAG: hypothetical protein ACFCUE_05975 [Candidatus Bathyarchaeia archaeon]|jgi:hypothetical protein
MQKCWALIFLLLLSLVFSGAGSVRANSLTVSVTPGYQTTLINEPVTFTATPSGGLSLYTYQWYTQLWPTWKPGTPYPTQPLGSEVPVKDATEPIFNFSSSKAGTYSISIQITDSSGDTVYNVFNPGGIWVFVNETTPSESSIAAESFDLLLISPANATYTTKSVPLSYSLTNHANWVGYSIDDQANVTVNGNLTLTELPNGLHTLTIYANNTDGNAVKNQTVTFETKNEAVTNIAPETCVTAITATVLVCAAGGLLLFFTRKHRRSSK